jgi:hypothetical protein
MVLKTFYPFATYGISPCGQVVNRTTGRVLKQVKNIEGYLSVGLRLNGATKMFRVHRLVALVYIPNPKKLPQVNHKDLDKQNNHKSNLEWVTNRENTIHAVANGKKGGKPKRSVYKISNGRLVLDKYGSVCEAAAHNGLDFSNIYAVIRGEREKCGGFYWEFT